MVIFCSTFGALAHLLKSSLGTGILVLSFKIYVNQYHLTIEYFFIVGYAHGLQKCRSAFWRNRNYRRWTPLHPLCPYSGEI